MALSARKIETLKTPGMYSDGGTLFLRVAPGGSKQWVQRLTVKGRRRDIGLGGYPLVSMAEARAVAFNNRKLARAGDDPIAERQKAKVPTFREAAAATFETLRPRWRSDKVAANWMQQLERHAMRRLGPLPVDTIGREDVLRVLTPIWTATPETARRVRRCIKATLRWAVSHGHAEANMAGEVLDGALPRLPSVKAHLRALPYRDVPQALDTIGDATIGALALRFVILTAARSGEVRGATWAEVDLDSATWTIPGDRMKAGREHRVPLTGAALDVLRQVKALDDGSGLVFPSPVRRGRPLSDVTLTKVLRDKGIAERATVHGFRSSFRDWCAETGKVREIAEAALAHTVKGVEGAYFRSDLFDRRRRLMEAWAGFVTGEGSATVVQIGARR